MPDSQAAAIAARLRAELAAVASELTLEVVANLIEATPVDTGHARANWVPSIGEPFAGEVLGDAARAAGIAAVTAYKFGDGALNITNNVPYISRLIGGSSSQAPAGWDVAAIDQALQAVQQRHDSVQIDVTRGGSGISIKPREPAP